MTFMAWLKRQHRRDDPIGDLSRDLLSLQEAGLRQSSGTLRIRCYGSFRRWLLEHDACHADLDAAVRAFEEYQHAGNP